MNWINNNLKSLYKENKNTVHEITNPDGQQLLIYHEKQQKELCALHALNNMYQEPYFTKKILDDICIELSPEEFINPHRSVLGRGNYNINVVMKAVQLKDHEAIWFDKRRSASILNLKNIEGFILNVPSDYKIAGVFSLPWEKKHWYAVTQINEDYYNLDSKANKPKFIGNEDELRKFLDNLLKSNNKELFVVVRKEVAETICWKIKE